MALKGSLDLKDTMPFGKYKGKRIEDIHRQDAGYLLWMRDTKKTDAGDAKFFDPEVLILLDETLQKDKYLRTKHQSWGKTILAQGPVTSPESAPFEPAEEATFAYAENW